MIGKTNAIGINNSDASLNFSVVASEIQPVGKENLIWLKTSAEIAGWVFQSEAPTNVPQNTVWIKIGTNSTVTFNAVKGDNVLKVYPIYCKLYDGSVWNDVEAKIYQNGSWKDWSLIIFVPDEDHKNMFVKKAIWNHIDRSGNADAIQPTVNYATGSYLQLSISNAYSGSGYGDRCGLIVSSSSIPLNNYTKVKFEYSDYSITSSGTVGLNGGVVFFVAPSSGVAPSSQYEVRALVIGNGTVEVPIETNLTSGYVGAEIYSNGNWSNSVAINITQITAI